MRSNKAGRFLTWRLGDIARQAGVHDGKIEVDSASPTVAVAVLAWEWWGK